MPWRKFGAATALSLTFGGGVILVDDARNPYTDKGTVLEISKVSTIEAAGENKIEVMKDEPKVVFSKWGGEAALGVRYEGLPADTTGSRAFLTDRMEWKGAKEEMHAYPLDASAGVGEDGGLEVEIVLNEKPATNVFDFAIDGADNLDFFYQPALTPEEIAEGADRSENVVGSYAVYHKTKANHRIGSTNYATGKAFHIYRPKAIDANGAQAWAELNYDNGTLSVTVPQKFLDDAVYPVRVDPTFGHGSLGISNTTLCTATSDSSTRIGNGIAGFTGTLDKISVGTVSSSGTQTVDTILYINTEDTVADSHSEVASAETLDLSHTTTASFKDITAAGESLSQTDYVINALCNGEDATAVINLRFDSLAGAGTAFNITAYTESSTGAGSYAARKESPWTETDSSATSHYSIYATYTCTIGTCISFLEFFSTQTWVAPSDVTSADVACWGGGGGGDVVAGSAGGGGGGGAFASSTVALTPTNTYTVTIGAGGQSGVTPTAGGDSSFVADDKTVLADGGTQAANTGNGTGGTVANSTGDVENDGGNGGDGVTTDDAGGGGGGAGGPHGDGGVGANASATVGGGGGGGNGGGNGGQPTAGTAGINAGAGGAGDSDGTGGASGGAGSSGKYGGGGAGGGDQGDDGGPGGRPGGGGGGGEIDGGEKGGAGYCTITYTVAAAEGGAVAPKHNVFWFD